MQSKERTYLSDFGWSLVPPPGWEQLGAEGGAASTHRPLAVVFAAAGAWSLSLSWMVSARKTDAETACLFQTTTMLAGPLSAEEARAVLQRIFPPGGEIEEACAVTLPDGSKALEITETIIQPGTLETRKGYQLVLPVSGSDGSCHFQRLSFQAPAREFFALSAEIRKSARTFHYVRPFGKKEEAARSA